jgi:tRNA pseudouridine(38-40) synthase
VSSKILLPITFQSHRKTIQDHVERAFERVLGKPVRVHGAGRTDTGVHALAQCAHVDLSDDRLSVARWTKALNALLPPTIRILRCQYVSHDFHARLSAKGKIYRYRIWLAPVLPPFEYRRAWHIVCLLDLKILKHAAKQFVGTHNFAGFAANRGKSGRRGDTDSSRRTASKQKKSTVRTIWQRFSLQNGSLNRRLAHKMRARQNARRGCHCSVELRSDRPSAFCRSSRRIISGSRALLTPKNRRRRQLRICFRPTD